MRLFMLISGAILVLLLSSCEGATDREFTVENKSSDTITVLASGFGEDTLTYTIPPTKSEMIKVYNLRGGQSDPGSPGDYFDFISIYSETDTAQLDFADQNRWTICSSHERKFPSWYVHTFLLKVNDAHFE